MNKTAAKMLLIIACLLLAAPLRAGEGHDHGGPSDARVAIALSPEEKHFLFTEMRELLSVTQRILEASLDNDMQAVARAARSVGMGAHQADFADQSSIIHAIRKKAPQAFLPLGRATHQAFDEIADIALNFGDREVVERRLAENLARCVACHATYRVTDAP